MQTPVQVLLVWEGAEGRGDKKCVQARCASVSDHALLVLPDRTFFGAMSADITILVFIGANSRFQRPSIGRRLPQRAVWGVGTCQ